MGYGPRGKAFWLPCNLEGGDKLKTTGTAARKATGKSEARE